MYLQLSQHVKRLIELLPKVYSMHELRERETLHLFQPPRADQMPDPLQGQD